MKTYTVQFQYKQQTWINEAHFNHFLPAFAYMIRSAWKDGSHAFRIAR